MISVHFCFVYKTKIDFSARRKVLLVISTDATTICIRRTVYNQLTYSFFCKCRSLLCTLRKRYYFNQMNYGKALSYRYTEF